MAHSHNHKPKFHRYNPIRDYTVIGNTHTVALIGVEGSIDWCCLPRFDSPSVFAKILDFDKGGEFTIRPLGPHKSEPSYEEDTNILKTHYHGRNGTVDVTDFMPIADLGGAIEAYPEIHRLIRCLDGSVEMSLLFDPKFDYGRITPKFSSEKTYLTAFARNESILLSSSRPGVLAGRYSKFKIARGESISFSLHYRRNESQEKVQGTELTAGEQLRRTREFWRSWIRRCKYEGQWRGVVRRSALTLKLLTYSGTGAIVAAGTASLPEVPGGARNWDYRYSWIRDSCFALWPLKRIGFIQEGNQFVEWLLQKCKEGLSQHQIVFGVEGERDLHEIELSHLDGYRKSRPVRVGNAASTQFQLDIYGEILDAIYFLHYHQGVSDSEYLSVRELADFICESYDQPDCGIWKVRNGRKMFVYSKLWCWVGLDRAARIASEMRHAEDASKWARLRDAIKKDILTRGWSDTNQCFRQHYDTTEPDSANLLMPLVGFIDASDSKFKRNLKTTLDQLSHNGFLYRYRADDGLPGEEGTFTLCALWAVACLARAGRIEEATELFERVLQMANHVGLYSEEIDAVSGEALGNFPQAFTHLNLINAALELDAAIKRKSQPKQMSV